MLSLTVAFWIMIFIFSFVGMMRGWTKEVVVTSSLVLALFTINQFMSTVFNFIGWGGNAAASQDLQRWQFFIMSMFLLVLAFFGYQGPTLARSRSDRLARRDNLQDKTLGFIVGMLNGWLIVGSIWGFLEYQLVSASNWVRFPQGVQYPFDMSRITRPPVDVPSIIDNLPIPFLTQSPFILPLLLVVVFLFVLVVLL